MNIKLAKTEHEIIDLIKNRWSPRSFSDKPLSKESMDTLFEAASWAFSSGNGQPWKYIYAHRENKESFEKLVHCLMPANQVWAKNAAVLMAVFMHKKTEHGNPNKTAMHDIGAANATLALQAESMNIYVHVMGGFDAAKTIETLDIDTAELEPVVFMALGYLGSPEKLEEPFKTRELTPRNRKPVKDFTFELK
jgi:nitroreductase